MACCHGNEDSLPPVDSAILVYAYPDGSPAACLRLGVDQLLPAWSAWLHRLRAFQLAQDRAAAKLTR
uniref:START domain-containing protein n=1 Tax=Macrostomum lignano TaxID=282301 RepID=A0A1I8H9Y5_9PLAT